MNKDLIIRQLCEDVADLKRRVAAMPVVVSPYQRSVIYLQVDKGNILDDGSDGIKFSVTLITSIPAYDPNINTSFITGIGRARAVRDGEIQDGYVLVVNDIRSNWASALLTGDPIASSGSVVISGQVCYVPV